MKTIAELRAEWLRLGGAAAFFDANVKTAAHAEAYIWRYFGNGRKH